MNHQHYFYLTFIYAIHRLQNKAFSSIYDKLDGNKGSFVAAQTNVFQKYQLMVSVHLRELSSGIIKDLSMHLS